MQTEAVSEVSTATLWDRFHDELLAFVRARVDSDSTARDILQTTFLRAHEQLAAGEAPRQPRAWLYQIVRNLSIDAHRRARSRRALAEAVAREPAAPVEDGDAEDVFAVVARALPMFIAALDEPYRDALRMTELEGLTHAEAAARAGVSVSGMKSRVQRGRQQVFRALQRCCEFELDARGHMIACAPRAPANDCC